MKTLLGITLAALLWSAGPARGVDGDACRLVEDPPISCPFCGGNVGLHEFVIGRMIATQAEASRILLTALRG